MRDEPQPKIKELDETVIPKKKVACKEHRVNDKVMRSYLVKLKTYSPKDAK